MSKNEKKHYFPMEVTPETVRDFKIDPNDVVWARIGNRKVRAVLIPVTENQYYDLMRPLWCEDKRSQRDVKPLSLDELMEKTGFEQTYCDDIEAKVEKQELINALHAAFDDLEKIDHLIMVLYGEGKSQREIASELGFKCHKSVGKRLNKIIPLLREKLKDFI